MNRLRINTFTHGGCVICGDAHQIRVDVSDFGIIGVFPCPACVEEQPIRSFMAPLMDYVTRPEAPGGAA